MPAEGYSNDPICPIMARVVGNGSSPPGLKETCRTGEELMREWIGPRSYVAGDEFVRNFSRLRELARHTSFFVTVNGVAGPLGVNERLPHLVGNKSKNRS